LLSLRVAHPASFDAASDVPAIAHVGAYDRADVPAAFGGRQGDDVWLRVPEVATFHLPAGSRALRAVPDDSVDSEAVLDAYYGTAMPLILQATADLEVMHSSGVRIAPSGRVVALCGKTGTGKSTTAYALSARGHSQWADDAVAFRMDGSNAVSVGLPYTVNLREPASELFGVGWGGQAVEELAWTTAPLGAVMVLEPPQPAGADASAPMVERLDPGDALRALLPHAFRFHPESNERKRATMETYLDLATSVPVLNFHVSHDLDRLPELLDELERWVVDLA
jgi:hypothetical protein